MLNDTPLKIVLEVLNDIFLLKDILIGVFRVAVHTSDVLWRKMKSHISLNTGGIVSLYNLLELWSIAMYCGGQ